MSSSARYGSEVTVPPGVPGMLKDFTKELLRLQPSPDDFYAFGLDYFQQLLEHEDSKGSIAHLPREEVRRVLDELFVEADVDGSGALSLSEFKEVLKRADLGLSETDARMLFAEVDIDDSGEISYEEFIPLAVDMIQSMYARMDAADEAADMEDGARREAEQVLHGMGRDKVMAVMSDIFRRADVDGSGALSLGEFQKCLKEANIGLTKKEIRILMAECDVDQDGTISYEEFVPVAYDILVEIVKSNFLQPKSDDELEQYLLSVWSSADTAGSGRLSVAQMSQALRDADLGLNRVQVHSVVGEAAVDPDDGLADYISYVPKASGIVSRLLNREAQMQRYEAVQKLGEEAARMPMNFEAELTKAVEARDPEGTGYVHISDILQVLTSGELPIELGDYEINALLSATEPPDEDGNFFYPEWLAFAPELLQYLMEDTALYQ